MPELPDIDAYIVALKARIQGELLESISINNPFFLRSVEPGIDACSGLQVLGLRRIGKRIAIQLEGDLCLIMHLMIAGRLKWADKPEPTKRPGRQTLARFIFTSGQLTVTEAGTKKRASLYVVRGDDDLLSHDPAGLEVLGSSLDAFRTALLKENRTLKRALTDPRILSGIGNAYSDEILNVARLSPVTWTSRLSADDIERLYRATQSTLNEWRDRLVDAAQKKFPARVTAFRPEMRVHGKFGEPCPACRTAIQRIRYASNETNYCPRCQTGGKLLADRALSRLLKANWPATIEELEKPG